MSREVGVLTFPLVELLKKTSGVDANYYCRSAGGGGAKSADFSQEFSYSNLERNNLFYTVIKKLN
jgi:hypothetical protein